MGVIFRGNLLTDGTRHFAYDDENELVAVWVNNTWSNSFAYDGLQRRRIENDFSWTGSAWQKTNQVYYVYDGNLVLQERNQNNMPLTTYTRGTDLSGTLQGAGGIGGLLARSDSELVAPSILLGGNGNSQYVVNSYYHNDGNGNITTLVEPNGFPVATYEYDPFGNVISMSGLMAGVNKYRFSSKEWNENAGLYYYGYRFYDPNLQRWLNRDPVQEWGGINLFQYVFNNPLTLTDPFGFCPPAGTGLEGGMAETNPGGINGPPALRFTSNPSTGQVTSENNDNPQLFAVAVGVGTLTVGSGLAVLGLDGPDEALLDEGVEDAVSSATINSARELEELQAERNSLQQVIKETQAQLDNGRDIAARERATFGNEPNPPGLAKEINETLPNEIKQAQARLDQINARINQLSSCNKN